MKDGHEGIKCILFLLYPKNLIVFLRNQKCKKLKYTKMEKNAKKLKINRQNKKNYKCKN